MSVFSEAAKNAMLDGATFNQVQLHSGDPGAAGTANTQSTKKAATFAAASGGERALDSAVEFGTGDDLSANDPVTWFSVWNSSGDVFMGKGEIDGDQQANAAGEYTLTTDTKLVLADPA